MATTTWQKRRRGKPYLPRLTQRYRGLTFGQTAHSLGYRTRYLAVLLNRRWLELCYGPEPLAGEGRPFKRFAS